MTTTYLSRAAETRLDQLQAEMADHLISDRAGRCLTCQQMEPCRHRDELTAAILALGRLPRRRPGLTKAGLRAIHPSQIGGA